ncbi:hypothetical protein Lser_V15G39529 [Lactuca serriola]
MIDLNLISILHQHHYTSIVMAVYDDENDQKGECMDCKTWLINLISLMMDISFLFISLHQRFPFLRQLSNHFPLFYLEDPISMILPVGSQRFEEAMQIGSETCHHLKAVIAEKYGAHGCNVGEDGGLATNITMSYNVLVSVASCWR